MRQPADQSRRERLTRMLERRRLAIQNEVYDRMQILRSGGDPSARRVDPDAENATAQDDLEFDLIQIHAEMAAAMTDALARVNTGDYGRCRECGEEIPGTRLRALPFATRCIACQEAVESVDRRPRYGAGYAGPLSPTFVWSSDDR